jgi:hypothetical protein
MNSIGSYTRFLDKRRFLNRQSQSELWSSNSWSHSHSSYSSRVNDAYSKDCSRVE